jgi:hypothetical protein
MTDQQKSSGKIIPNPVLLFFIYLCVCIAIYYKAAGSLLVDDGIAGLVKLQEQGLQAFWNSFGFTSLYYFHDFFDLLVYFFAGKSSPAWFAVMVTLHSLNATLGFVVFNKLYNSFSIRNAKGIALSGSTLFLLSPYQTENVIWAATLHYSIAMAILLTSLLILFNSLNSGEIKLKHAVLMQVLFAISIMTLEISLIFPAVYCLVAVFFIWSGKTSLKVQRLFTHLLLPFVCSIIIYFLATRLIKGHWLPHYGEAHLRNNSIQNYLSTSAKYALKFLGFVHFYNEHKRQLIYDFCNNWRIILIINIIIIGLCYLLIKKIRDRIAANLFVLLVAVSFFLLVPVLHMYFMYLFNTENDRLGYFFSITFYQLFAYVLISVFAYAGGPLCLAFLAMEIFFLHAQVKKWYEAGVVHMNCINSFIWTDAPKVFVLNQPANYGGVYEFRNNERLAWALRFFKDYQHSDSLKIVMSSCYLSPDDSTTVKVVNDSTLDVTIFNHGGWLMREAVGASDYGTDDYYVSIVQWPPGYRVIFHRKLPGAVYIFSTAQGFKRVDGF